MQQQQLLSDITVKAARVAAFIRHVDLFVLNCCADMPNITALVFARMTASCLATEPLHDKVLKCQSS